MQLKCNYGIQYISQIWNFVTASLRPLTQWLPSHSHSRCVLNARKRITLAWESNNPLWCLDPPWSHSRKSTRTQLAGGERSKGNFTTEWELSASSSSSWLAGIFPPSQNPTSFKPSLVNLTEPRRRISISLWSFIQCFQHSPNIWPGLYNLDRPRHLS